MEDEESLEASAVVSQLPDPIKDQVHNLLANGVVASGVVVSSVLFATHHLLRMEQLTVGSAPDLINNRGFQIQEDSSWNMFPSSSLTEEG